jgi:DNA-binding NarL/FixJ family response regulator
MFRDSAGLLSERDVFGYRPWALSGLARARALSGEEESAVAALDEARRSLPVSRNFDMSLYLAETEIHRAAGRTAAALEAAGKGVAWAREAGMIGDEVQGLQSLVRVQPSAAAVTRLAELENLTDSPMARAIADFAQAVMTSDANSLREVSERFAAMSAWWAAAEAELAAAVVLERRHESRAAAAAARQADDYAGRCETLRLPSTGVLTGPGRLTNREQEVATLAARGRSSKEIADGLHLSPRTVENHLHHAYIKLGVTDRAGLAEALAPGPEPHTE